jgi:DNA-binding MarR family transcriptional regulator
LRGKKVNIDTYLNMLNDCDHFASQFRSQVKDCSLIEFRIMDMVAKQPEMRLNEIGLERSVYQQGIGRAAKNLHERGLVKVVRSQRDGRAKQVELTDEGRRLRAKCRMVLEGIVRH